MYKSSKHNHKICTKWQVVTYIKTKKIVIMQNVLQAPFFPASFLPVLDQPQVIYLHQHLFVQANVFGKACSVSLFISTLSDTGSPSVYLTSFSSVLFSVVDFLPSFLPIKRISNSINFSFQLQFYSISLSMEQVSCDYLKWKRLIVFGNSNNVNLSLKLIFFGRVITDFLISILFFYIHCNFFYFFLRHYLSLYLFNIYLDLDRYLYEFQNNNIHNLL